VNVSGSTAHLQGVALPAHAAVLAQSPHFLSTLESAANGMSLQLFVCLFALYFLVVNTLCIDA
jgi:hypothetical protein